MFNSGEQVVIEQDGLVLTSTITAVTYPGDENCFDEQGNQTTAYIYIDDFLNDTSIGALMPGSMVYIGGHQEDDVIDVVWNGEPNQINQAIDNAGGSGTFRLEANRTYLVVDPLYINNNVKIIELKMVMVVRNYPPIHNADGNLSFYEIGQDQFLE